jgi:putative DNA primase/helicase
VPRYTTKYEIRDVDGALVAVHHRQEFVDGRKSFTWNRPSGEVGLGGTPAANLPLYRSETLAGLSANTAVVLVEGEKAGEALARTLGAGVGAVATVTGAAATPSAEVLGTISGRRVILWPDADQVGRSHMARIAERLAALGCQSVRVVEWSEAPEHGDAADFVGSHDREELLGLLRAAAPWEPIEATGSTAALAPKLAERESEGDHLNAERFLAEYGDQVRFVPQLKQLLVWNGSWWRPDAADQAREWARRSIEGLKAWVVEGTGKEFDRRAAHYRASCRAERISGLLTVAATACRVSVEELDLRPDLLPCLNGTVDLRTGELSPADPTQFLTEGVALEYDPDARSELWERVVSQACLGKPDLVGFLRRLLGYSATGHAREEVLVIAHGTGANGKSAIFGTVQHVLGPLGASAPEGLFTDLGRSGLPHPERVAWLRGRRLVVSYELEKRSALAEGLVKALTGGDTITAREMHGRRFEFAPTFTPFIVTNHRPRVRGTDEGIWRRIVMVPFEYRVPDAARDESLKERLKSEHAQAVLTWLVRGAVEWYAAGLGRPAEVEAATSAFRASEDTFSAFWAECVEPAPRDRVKVGDLFAAWSAYVKPESGGRVSDFRARLDDMGMRVETRRNAWVLGYRLVPDGVPEGPFDLKTAGTAGTNANSPYARAEERFTSAPAVPAVSAQEDVSGPSAAGSPASIPGVVL